ncbi:MAG: flagellar hook-associated protein FlgK [Motilibacteraceae bacterium]
MSTFSGLSTALSALYAQRRGLDVTGQNIANANTEGYSRQRVDLQSVGAPVTPAIWSVYSGAGQGVDVSGVQRLRDAFLELRGQTEHGRLSYFQGVDAVYGQIEQSLGEPSDTGIQSQLSDFWAGWHDVANAPGDPAARSQLLQRAQTLTDGLNKAADSLSTQWGQLREQLGTTLSDVNSVAANVADLNQAILRADQAGLPDSELKDQRDGLVMKLADAVGGRVVYGDNGVADVYLGGTALVRGSTSLKLQVSGASDLQSQSTDPVRITWAKDGSPADVTTGSAAALAQGLTTTVPSTLASLDSVAAAVVTRVNALHTGGFDLAGNPGADFFDPAGTTAAGIRLNPALTDHPELVAASGTAGATLDASQADALARLGTDPTGPDSTYRQVIVDLGVQAQTATRRAAIQSDVTSQVDAARDAQSGVNLDEEMINMVQYQHAYEGAARLMTAVDQTLDTLIHNTGLVGR